MCRTILQGYLLIGSASTGLGMIWRFSCFCWGPLSPLGALVRYFLDNGGLPSCTVQYYNTNGE